MPDVNLSSTTARQALPARLARWALGASLAAAGVGHLTTLRREFQAQVPAWVPLDPDVVVVASGVVEIALGVGLVVLPRHRRLVGAAAAAFFVAIFPGNVAQYVEGTDAFNLDSDAERLARLFFQPVLVAWALWAGGHLGGDDAPDDDA